MRVLFLILFLTFTLNAKPFFSNADQACDSKYIGALKNLIIATQKTRGETNSYMNGNLAALFLVYEDRRDIKNAIGIMESLPLATDPVINNRATAISRSLVNLDNNAFTLKPKKVFSLYTSYIAQILMLAQAVYERTYTQLDSFAKQTSSIMMNGMLPMTELVGQIRGFGSGLAAKSSVSKKEFVKILVLSNLIKKQNDKLYQQLNKLIKLSPKKLPLSMNQKISNLKKSTANYLYFIKKNFKVGDITVNATNYFNNGTKVISSIIAIYSLMNKAILQDSQGWF